MKAVASPNATISQEDLGRAASLFRLLSKTTALASFILVMIGTMMALAQIDDRYFFSEAIVAAFSGLVLGLLLIMAVFEPAVFLLKKRQDAQR